MLFGPWGPHYKLYAALATPFILYAIYLTDSRGGYLSLLIVVFLHFRTRFRNVFGYAAGAALVAVMCVAAPSRFGDFNDKNKSASYRVDMWMESMEMVKYNPVLGIGKGNFRSYTKKLIAHNSFLEVMGETGFVGLFLWLSLLYVSVMSLVKARALIFHRGHRSLVDGLLICIAGYLATSLFITAEFELLYVLLALSMVVARLTGQAVEYKLPDMKRVAAVQFAGVTGFWLFTKVYYRVFA
jgi:O-antigen ligase